MSAASSSSSAAGVHLPPVVLPYVVSPNNYKPPSYTKESECTVEATSFAELSQTHFQTKKTPSPYFLLLSEDANGQSNLCDATKTLGWFTKEFQSPQTNKPCQRVYVLVVHKLNDRPTFFACATDKTELAERMNLISSEAVNNSIEQTARKALFNQLKETECIDEVFLNWAHLILQHNPKDKDVIARVLAFLVTITKENVTDHNQATLFDTLAKCAPQVMHGVKKEDADRKTLTTCLQRRATALLAQAAELFADVPAIQMAGGALFSEGTTLVPVDLAKAHSCFEKALTKQQELGDDACTACLLALAQIAKQQHDFVRAKTYLGRALNLQPNNTTVMCEIADLALQEGDIVQALWLFREICMHAKPDATTRTYIARLTPVITERLEQAKKALSNTDISDEELLRTLILIFNLDDGNDEMVARLITLIEKGTKENAEACVTRVAKECGGSPMVQNALGDLFFLGSAKIKQNYNQAIIYYKRVIALAADHPAALARLGTIQYNFKEFKNAEETLEKAVKMNPNDAETHRLLADVYRYFGENTKSLNYLQRAREIDPTPNVFEMRCQGDVLRSLKRYDQARAILEKALQVDQNNAFGQAVYGEVLAKLGHLEPAKTALRKALEISPNYQYAQDMLDELEKPCCPCIIM